MLEDSSFIRRRQEIVIPQEEWLDPCGRMFLVGATLSRVLHFHPLEQCGPREGILENHIEKKISPV